MENQKDNKVKKVYIKPEIVRVELVAEEVLGVCDKGAPCIGTGGIDKS